MDPRIRLLEEGPVGSRPNWYEYGMALALVSGTRATCKKVRAGSYYADVDHRTLSTGYNGAAPGVESCLDFGGCKKEAKTGRPYEETMNSGNCIGLHGEMNGVAPLDRSKVKGHTLFTTVFPCTSCSKNLMAYSPSAVVFKRFYDEREAPLSLDFFQQGKIDVYRLDLSPERMLDILFNQEPVEKFEMWSPEERERMQGVLEAARKMDPSKSRGRRRKRKSKK